jgi:hypothetical protein
MNQDMSLAMNFYRKAIIEGDDPLAHLAMARNYVRGNGVSVDYEKAHMHLKRALAADLPEARIYWGILQYLAIGCPRDVAAAKVCFELAASRGYFYAYGLIARLQFADGAVFRGIATILRGWKVGITTQRTNPLDRRMLGKEKIAGGPLEILRALLRAAFSGPPSPTKLPL